MLKRLLGLCAVAALVGVQIVHAAPHAPQVTLTSVTFRNDVVDLRFRLCVSIGPRAVILTHESRRVRGTVVAAASAIDPLGVDMTKVASYGCVSNYMSSWVVKKNLIGAGTYTVTLRVRDGYGVLSKAVSFSVTNP